VAEAPANGVSVAKTQAYIQAAVGAGAMACATAATLTDHMDDSTYAAMLFGVLGWAFANFRHATSHRPADGPS
jgi:hypothetical protein